MGPLLFDTHVAIWYGKGELGSEALAAIFAAALDGGLFVSPVTAWEIGLLARPKPARPPIVELLPDPLVWFEDLMAESPLTLAPLTSRAAILSATLPEWSHKDPADRLLVATARDMNATLLTGDAAILAYAAQGHVKALHC